SSYDGGSAGRSASRAGSGGNAACGSVWYQYATDAYSFAKLLAWPCSTVQRSEHVKRIGSLTNQRYAPVSPACSGDSTRWKPWYALSNSRTGHAPPPKISSVPVPWIDGRHT